MSSFPYRLFVLTNSISRMNGGIFDAMRNLTIAIAAGDKSSYLPVVFSAQDIYTKADEPLWGRHRNQNVRGPRSAHLWLCTGTGERAQIRSCRHSSRPRHLDAPLRCGPSLVAREQTLCRQPARPAQTISAAQFPLEAAAALLYEDEHLRRAACLHALNAAEAEAMREYGLKNPICVIPNGTTLPECRPHREPPKSRTILYLGRLHSLKGLQSD